LDAESGAGGPDLAFFLTFFPSAGTARVASSASARISGKKGRIACGDGDSEVPTNRLCSSVKIFLEMCQTAPITTCFSKLPKTNGGAPTGSQGVGRCCCSVLAAESRESGHGSSPTGSAPDVLQRRQEPACRRAPGEGWRTGRMSGTWTSATSPTRRPSPRSTS